MILSIDFEKCRFSLTLEQPHIGWAGLVPGVEFRDGWQPARFSDVRETADGGQIVEAEYDCGLRETLTFKPYGDNAFILRRSLANPTQKSVSLRYTSIRKSDGAVESGPLFDAPVLHHARFAHLDNLRTEDFPKCRAEYPFLRPLPWQTTEFGNQESQAAPYLILTTDRQRNLLFEGQLDQSRTRCSWCLGVNETGTTIGEYRLNWRFPGAGGITLHEGESLDLEPVLYRILTDSSLADAIRLYGEDVVDEQGWGERENPLNHAAFYCSWNYGNMRNISHESLMKTARFTADNLPGVTHFLIDGGWVPWEAGRGPHLGNFNLADDDVYDHEKFPHGMKGIADAIRETGLKPAIHWTPFVRLNTQLAQAHPDWFCQDESGDLYRIGDYGFFDYSLPEVQEFIHHVFTTIFKTWGFEAMKMDFWSQSVESNDIRYRNGDTGVVWRDWLLSTIESCLPEDGFLMTCVATAIGNPFLGKHARSYRAGMDVGNGAWAEHILACSWLQPLLTTDERCTALHNIDGLGISANLSGDENLHRLTYGFISMGSLEVDGKFEELPDYQLEWLRRLTRHIDRGYPVKTADDQVNTGVPLPKCLYVDYPEDSPTYKRGVRKHIALFNWSDHPQFIGATHDALGLDGETKARDFWTDETRTFGPDGICELLPPHSARLYEA